MQQTNVSATAYDDAYRTMCFLGADIVLVAVGALLVRSVYWVCQTF